MTDLLTVGAKERVALLDELDDDNRDHYFATSKCPINKQVDDMMEEISRVVCQESFTAFWKPGHYHCSRCEHVLYHSSSKFDGPCAWPSFRSEADSASSLFLNHVTEYNNYTCTVYEIYCGNCKLFLGHKFEDGPLKGDTHPDAHWRHCVLSYSLKFVPKQP
jgi:peptide-methionine (R)-S-oxide reductase